MTNRYTGTVDTLQAQHKDRAVRLLTLGFAADPVCRHLYPDVEQYLRFFPEYAAVYGQPAFDHGSAHAFGHFGVALWTPPGHHADEDALQDLLERSVEKSEQQALFDVYEAFDDAHPKEPHWFLPLMAVDPHAQGQGVGAALMEYGTKMCDRDAALAYLESTNPVNIPFYERFGFKIDREIQIGSHPVFHTMIREPHPLK